MPPGKNSQWKGIQYDYDALAALDPNNSCLYCLSDRDVQIILAALEFVGWKTRYFSTSGATIEQDTIDGWQGHLGAALMSCNSLRQDPENPCLLQELGDDGEWTTFANLRECPPHLRYVNGQCVIVMPDDSIIVPENSQTEDGRTAPFTPPARGGTIDEAICLASANAENVIYNMHAQVYTGVFVPDATWAALVLVAVIVGLLALPIALAIIVSVIIAGGGVAILSGIGLDDYTTTIRRRLRCIFIAHATNTSGVVTFDFDAVQADVEARISGINIWAAINLYLSIIGESGLNRAGATTAITEFDCSDCECTGTSVNFGSSDLGWTTHAWDVYSAYGVYGSGAWNADYYPNSVTPTANMMGLQGDVDSVCGDGIQINVGLTPGAPTTPTMHIRVTTSTQVKNLTVTAGTLSGSYHWDEGGSLDEDSAVVEFGYTGAPGYGAHLVSFQTADI